MSNVVVSGMGIVSAIGNNKQEVLASLIAHQSGIAPIVFLPTKHKQYPVGEVKLSNEQLVSKLGTKEPLSRTAMLGMLAFDEAVRQAHLTKENFHHSAFISGTCVGGMDLTEQNLNDYLNNTKSNLIKQHACGEHTHAIAQRYGDFAYITTLSTACSTALNAIIHGIEMIENGFVDFAIVGSAECLTRYHFNGFRTLHILDEKPCRPFDATRQGINLGEGAAYLVLESETSALSRGVEPIARIIGYGNTCDAFHQTASSENGEGAYLAMKQALNEAQLQPQQINYLNAHGTGTPNNDQSESIAIRRIFGNDYPPVSSTKAFTGHTTAASGAIESVICLLAMQNNFIPVNLNWQEPMPENAITPYAKEEAQQQELNYVMCNAFGFGGNDSSIIFSKKGEKTTQTKREAYAYIKSCTQISAQQPLSELWMQQPILSDQQIMPTIEPQYSDFISPNQARRMTPILKRALTTALKCMRDANIEQPDAIIAGTGLGCIASTENFLMQIQNNDEEMLSPTPFMQSTHNTISSLLAIHTQNHAYNNTFSHLDNSFEACFADMICKICKADNKINNVLIGAYDELTPLVSQLLTQAGYFGKDAAAKGTETAVSMLISTQPTHCKITDFVLPENAKDGYKYLDHLLEDGDCLLLGVNGDTTYDQLYKPLIDFYYDVPLLHYKHLFGESLSSSAMGVYVAAQCIFHNHIPECLHYKVNKQPKTKGIIFVNYTKKNQLSAIRLQKND